LVLYTWDNRNRLIEVRKYDGNETYDTSDNTLTETIDYRYDAFNELIYREDAIAGGSTTQTAFIYDGGQVVLQFDKSGTSSVAAGDLSHRYLWNPQAVDQLFADEQVDWTSDSDADGPVMWALTDKLSSVRDVVDSNGVLRLHREFDSVGNVTGESHYNASGGAVTSGQTGYVDEAFAFTGRWLDKAARIQNNLNRWYDSFQGRFISEDPLGFTAGDANLYRYVSNNSLKYVDPSGLEETNPITK
jgi:RHS repeat-associated protein